MSHFSAMKYSKVLCLVLAVFATTLFSGVNLSAAEGDLPYTGEALPRPQMILVYDFSSDPSDIPPASPLRQQMAGAMAAYQDASHKALGRQLGMQIASNLAGRIKDMGLAAQRASYNTKALAGDIVLKGYFLSMDKGDTAKRVGLGFGAGGAELEVNVEGYQMTDQGLRFLGSAHGKAKTGKSPGTALGIGTTIATANPVGLMVGGALKARGEMTGSATIDGAADKIAKKISKRLKEAFQRQGWIA